MGIIGLRMRLGSLASTCLALLEMDLPTVLLSQYSAYLPNGCTMRNEMTTDTEVRKDRFQRYGFWIAVMDLVGGLVGRGVGRWVGWQGKDAVDISSH